MYPYLVVSVGALLFALFLLIVAGMVWQEARKRSGSEGPAYVVEDAIAFAWEGLDDEVRSRLTRSDVRRIFEWEVYYLQGLADRRARGVDIVAGSGLGIDFIRTKTAAAHAADYSAEDIRAVLELEAQYLVGIGAVGEAIGEVA